ncbi:MULTISPECIES: PaaI family thioesterase [unclassified Actinomyces]|uniref:PaaI family thioesterase n=1 Tax=unclassified Actinomyces TaxID=2609248 RepID=UPI002017CCB1|nr:MULTISPECIES: PaaI family thioesterase [unclassified Actinomyces]MCL3777510.1 PaaI family thioesterase [Actinomyces sp. AC-20-1]MCL3790090.1 PaaI family thioesterase [Actinomyces sp. 187325]MCL3792375.1 PaaI family thioesterase [Actinomyces sp. 186855]MCL3794119.1 PaaI family thioesterase [Actinomyces sp. 217892]
MSDEDVLAAPSPAEPPAGVEAPVAFPVHGTRPFPAPRPAGSAVSAPSAVRAGLEAWEQGTLMTTLGMEVVERGRERVVVRMPVRGATQVVGILHGGASAALIETAASVAARQSAPEGTVPAGAELHVSHLRPVRAGHVTAVAVPVHQGRRTAVHEVTVSDDEGRTVARGTLRSLYTEVG